MQINLLKEISGTYTCPECHEHIVTNFLLVEQKKVVKQQRALWCYNSDCQAKHKIIYSIYRSKKTQNPKLKIWKFLSNDKPYSHKIKLLNKEQ